jgi:hypothetical protein
VCPVFHRSVDADCTCTSGRLMHVRASAGVRSRQRRDGAVGGGGFLLGSVELCPQRVQVLVSCLAPGLQRRPRLPSGVAIEEWQHALRRDIRDGPSSAPVPQHGEHRAVEASEVTAVRDRDHGDAPIVAGAEQVRLDVNGDLASRPWDTKPQLRDNGSWPGVASQATRQI